MLNKEQLLRPDNSFVHPMHGGPFYKPDKDLLDYFFSDLDKKMDDLGVTFPIKLPIIVAMKTPVDDLTDFYIDLSFRPRGFPELREYIGINIIVSNAQGDINEIHLSQGPWADGGYLGNGDRYQRDYWPSEAYLNLLIHTVDEFTEVGLFVQCQPNLGILQAPQ